MLWAELPGRVKRHFACAHCRTVILPSIVHANPPKATLCYYTQMKIPLLRIGGNDHLGFRHYCGTKPVTFPPL